jgi:hypothetical protein
MCQNAFPVLIHGKIVESLTYDITSTSQRQQSDTALCGTQSQQSCSELVMLIVGKRIRDVSHLKSYRRWLFVRHNHGNDSCYICYLHFASCDLHLMSTSCHFCLSFFLYSKLRPFSEWYGGARDDTSSYYPRYSLYRYATPLQCSGYNFTKNNSVWPSTTLFRNGQRYHR